MSLFFIFSSSFLFFTRLTYLSISIYSMNGIDGLRRMQMMTKFCNSGFPCPPPLLCFHTRWVGEDEGDMSTQNNITLDLMFLVVFLYSTTILVYQLLKVEMLIYTTVNIGCTSYCDGLSVYGWDWPRFFGVGDGSGQIEEGKDFSS